MVTLPVYNREGKQVDTANLDAHVFDGTINKASIYQVINAYRASQRSGLASTKTRGEVSGGGRKPWKQKGTGRARVGSIRSPLWRHGGVVFGPHPRDFSFSIPRKLKKLALKSALNEKIKEDNFIVLDALKIEKPKTKEAYVIISRLKMNASKNKTQKAKKQASSKKESTTLLLLDKIDHNVKLALRNIDFLNIKQVKDTNTYEVMAHKEIIVTKSGLDELTERLK